MTRLVPTISKTIGRFRPKSHVPTKSYAENTLQNFRLDPCQWTCLASFPNCSRTRAPFLRRHYPASSVVRAHPPPHRPSLTLAGCRFSACHTTDGVSRVASLLIFCMCRHHYPGGNGRCICGSLPVCRRPSPFQWRVGFRITGFEACSMFALAPAHAFAEPPEAALLAIVLQTILLPP